MAAHHFAAVSLETPFTYLLQMHKLSQNVLEDFLTHSPVPNLLEASNEGLYLPGRHISPNDSNLHMMHLEKERAG